MLQTASPARNATAFGPENGLSLTSALLGLFIMMVVFEIAAKVTFANQQSQKQALVAGYYQVIGNALGRDTSATPSVAQAVSAGLLPAQFANAQGGLNADALGVAPTISTTSSGIAVVSHRAVPEKEIDQINGLRSFGVSGEGSCSRTTVCGNNGVQSWSVTVPQPQTGFAYYGYEG
jgi:hypothetical protein